MNEKLNIKLPIVKISPLYDFAGLLKVDAFAAPGGVVTFVVLKLVPFCYRICTAFESMKENALRQPKDTKEMIDLQKYVEEAQQKTLIKLKADIKVCFTDCESIE